MTDRRGGRERSFGLGVGGVCGLLAAYLLWRGRVTPAGLFGLFALGLAVPALMKPTLLRIPSALWWRFSQVLGWINAHVLLSVVFFLILTPVGVIFRLTGWDPLRRWRGRRGSGWAPYPERHRDPKHYERMY